MSRQFLLAMLGGGEYDYNIGGVWNYFQQIYPYFPIRLYKQLTWFWKTQREGGYWITFGEVNTK